MTWQVCGYCSRRLGDAEFDQPPGTATGIPDLPGIVSGRCPYCAAPQKNAVFAYSPETQKQISLNRDQTIRDKKTAIDAIKMTSGFTFDRHTISEYFGFISEETVVGMGFLKGIAASITDLTGSESESLRKKLLSAKQTVMARLRENAFHLGANAIIGLDLDYTMFGGSLLGVIVSGTAVKISPNGAQQEIVG